MSNEPDPRQRRQIVGEAVEALLADNLPADVRESVDGNLPAPVFDQSELTHLESMALRQAGVGAGQIAVQVLQVELVQMRRELERLEKALTTQGQQSISEGRIVFIVFAVLSAIAVVVTLWGVATGKF